MKEDSARTTVSLRREQRAFLEQVARETDRSMASVIRLSIDFWRQHERASAPRSPNRHPPGRLGYQDRQFPPLF